MAIKAPSRKQTVKNKKRQSVSTDSFKIQEILIKGVEDIIEKPSLLNKLKSGKKLRIKLGLDPTGPKIHLGRAEQLWKLKAFQDLGHQIVLVLGDFTAQIGDASDKTSMRKPLSLQEVKRNLKEYLPQIGKILDLSKTDIRYNSQWLTKIKLQEMLRLASYFTSQQMIQRRNFKERWELGKPIGLHELYYPILQGYDSVVIKSDVEIGGYDQLFNLQIGRELQKIFGQSPQDIMILKMLPNLEGEKMSTSKGNLITIVDSPREMYGKIMSLKDELIPLYFELAANYPSAEVSKIIKQLNSHQINPKILKAQLAKEIVALYYGRQEALKEAEWFEKTFTQKQIPQDMVTVVLRDSQAPLLVILKHCFSQGQKSVSEIKRLINYGAVEIDGQVKKNPYEIINLPSTGLRIKIGKRNWFRVLPK
ncbi:MAG: tyrosine--tRNA ligase [Candidatus Pacebacteria bacterium]|nr:tyrosine--tRNA ligase [Candidatus Paceibacterota bacterium]